jgi:hypothetical protein
MKKFKKLIPALAMLLVSATAMSSATFAWFSMNREVSATSMEVRAVAEQGILINEVQTANDTNWDSEATAKQAASADASLLYPASTTDGSAWYHAASKKSNSAAAATSGTKSGDIIGDYETLSGLTAITAMSKSATAGSEAKRETMGAAADAPAGYYVRYEYYLKSSGQEITLKNEASGDQYVSVKSVTATATANEGSGSTNLNKSLRVGIKMNSAFYIYAPVTGYTATYYVNASSTATNAIAGTTVTPTDLAKLPAASADGAKVEVFIWYEGEDANCMTDNATAAKLDDIKVDIVFSLDTRA